MEEPPPQDDDPNSSTLNSNKPEKLGVGKNYNLIDSVGVINYHKRVEQR